jgi:hypothetical protein
MKIWKKVAIGAASLVVVGVGSAAAFVSMRWDQRYDDVSGPDLHAVTDSATIARGESLGPSGAARSKTAASTGKSTGESVLVIFMLKNRLPCRPA